MHRKTDGFTENILFINLSDSVSLHYSDVSTDSGNEGDSGSSTGQLVLFSLFFFKHWLCSRVHCQLLITTFSSLYVPGKGCATCESPGRATEVLSFSKTWKTVVWEEQWTCNGEANSEGEGRHRKFWRRMNSQHLTVLPRRRLLTPTTFPSRYCCYIWGLRSWDRKILDSDSHTSILIWKQLAT